MTILPHSYLRFLQVDIALALIKAGADIDATNKEEQTPLQITSDKNVLKALSNALR